MIKLSAQALADEFIAPLSIGYRPTHAKAMSHAVTYGQSPEMNVTYWFGALDAAGNFVLNQHVPIVSFQLPNAMHRLASRDETELLMQNLLGEGVAPHPKDPRDTVEVPGKAAGDWKVQDVDAVAAWVHPRLRGDIV